MKYADTRQSCLIDDRLSGLPNRIRWTLPEGAKGVQLVEAALQSWKERRWVDVPELAL